MAAVSGGFKALENEKPLPSNGCWQGQVSAFTTRTPEGASWCLPSIQREERAAVNRCPGGALRIVAVRCFDAGSMGQTREDDGGGAGYAAVLRGDVGRFVRLPPELIGRSPFPMQLKEEHFCQRLRTEHALFDIYCSSTPIRRGDGNLSVAHLKPARDLIAFRVLEADFLTHASFVQGTPWVHHRGCNHAG